MAGGDIEVLFTADDREVSEGMSRLKIKAGGFAAELENANKKLRESFVGFKNAAPAAIGAGTAAMGLALKSARDYAEQNSYIKGQFTTLEMSARKSWTAIGRDIAAGGIGPLDTMLVKLEKVRQKGVDALSSAFRDLAGALGGDSIIKSVDDEMMIDQAMRDMEQLDKAARDKLVIERELARVATETARVKGQAESAARLEVEMRRKEELRALNDLGLPNGADKNMLTFAINEKAKWSLKAIDDEARARQTKDAEEKKREEESLRRKEEAKIKEEESIELAQKRAELEMQAMEWEARRGKEADKIVDAQLNEIEIERKRLDIKHDDALSWSQKYDLINRLQAIGAANEADILKRGGKTRDVVAVASGINVSGGALSAARGGATLTVATQTRDAAMRTAKAVEKIADYGVSAVYQ